MKKYSPILFFLILILSACKDTSNTVTNSNNTIQDNINNFIAVSNDLRLDKTKRIRFGDKAYQLALASKQDTLEYKGLYNKIQIDLLFAQDSIPYFLKRLKELANKKESNSYLGGYYFHSGTYYNNKNIDSSFINYNNSVTEYLKDKDSLRAGYSLLIMANLQRSSSDYFGAESTATAALDCLKNSKNKTYLGAIHNLLGMIYQQLFNYENALKNYEKALEIAENQISKDVISNNIALVHMDNKNYKKAIEILTGLITKNKLDAYIDIKAKALDNLGYTYFLNGDDKGLNYMKESLKVKDSIDDKFGLLANCLHLSEYYLKSDPKSSRTFAFKAYGLANFLGNTDDKLDAIELMTKTSSSKRETDSLFLKYIRLSDSIAIVRQQAKNQFAKIRYDSKSAEKESLKYQAENAENKLKAEKAKRRNELLLLTISFIILIVILLYRLLKSRHEKEKFQEAYKTETRIAKKVHDELANDVYNVMTFATTQNLEKPEKREILINSLDSVYLRTRDISRENSPIELGENFPDQLKDMISEYQTESLNVLIKDIYSIEWMKIDDNKKLVTYRVIQELMVNMKKHSGATLAVIAFSNLDKKVQIQYSDNGVGIKQGKTFFKNGLQNVENRIESIRGSLIFDLQTNRGVKLFFTYPV